MKPQLCRYTIASVAMLLTWSSFENSVLAQQAQDLREAELNMPVSNAGEPGPIGPGPGGGGGEASFSGAEGEAANDALAEFGATTESANEVWELWSLPPATAPIGIETIIPPDTRTQVTNTTTFPERAVALITFDGGRPLRARGWQRGQLAHQRSCLPGAEREFVALRLVLRQVAALGNWLDTEPRRAVRLRSCQAQLLDRQHDGLVRFLVAGRFAERVANDHQWLPGRQAARALAEHGPSAGHGSGAGLLSERHGGRDERKPRVCEPAAG
jgi:hypothetical protein